MSEVAIFIPIVDVVLASCRAYTTKQRYTRKLSLYFAWWNSVGQPRFCRDTVQNYMATLNSQASFQRMHSLTALKKLASEAFYRQLIDQHTLKGIEMIESPKVCGSRQGKRLSVEEITAALAKPDDSMAGKRDRLALALMFYAGLRRAEACTVTVAHLQVIEGRPVIANLIGKGERVRTVPIPQQVMDWAQEWIKLSGVRGVLLRSINRWGQVSKTPMSPDSLYLISMKYAGVACHDLRRTMGSLARKAGVELDQIQQVYGHADIRTTQGYIGGTLNLKNAVCDSLPSSTISTTIKPDVQEAVSGD
jgi:integrase/recombinase XerD